MIAFRMRKIWALLAIGGKYMILSLTSEGKQKERKITGRKRIQQNNTLRNKTGITALLSRDIFLITSYTPSSEAEMNAKINHIERKFACKDIYLMR